MYCPNPIHGAAAGRAERVEVVALRCSDSTDVAHGPRLANQSRDVFHVASRNRHGYIRLCRKSIERHRDESEMEFKIAQCALAVRV